MKITEKKLQKWDRDFKKLSKDTNEFFMFLSLFMSATGGCLIYIMTNSPLLGMLFGAIYLAFLMIGMREIFFAQKKGWFEMEITNEKNRE
ncbi:hypothetical protein ACI2U6_16420 [Ralstonia nicotianae]